MKFNCKAKLFIFYKTLNNKKSDQYDIWITFSQQNKRKYPSTLRELTNKRTRFLCKQRRPKIDEKFAKSGRLAVAHKVSSVNHSVLWWCTVCQPLADEFLIRSRPCKRRNTHEAKFEKGSHLVVRGKERRCLNASVQIEIRNNPFHLCFIQPILTLRRQHMILIS